jgi:hypothetical protein
MNQRFRVLQELGEQFERAAEATNPHAGARRRRRAGSLVGRFLRAAPGAIAISLMAFAAVAIAVVALVLVRPASQPPAGHPAGPGDHLLLSRYAILRRPQTAAERAEADAGPAAMLNRRPFGVGGGSSSLHYLVRIVGLGRYENVPTLTRMATVDGVQVWFFVVYASPSDTLPRAIVTGNDPRAAARYTTRRYLSQMARVMRPNAGYGLWVRIGQGGRPRPITPDGSSLAHPDALTVTTNGSLPGPHGTMVGVVPDGVARLGWIWPREFDSRALSYQPAVSMSASVSDNLAIASAPARFASGEEIAPQAVVYYSAAGRVLGRYTNPGNSALVYLRSSYAPQTPGPQTPLSLRAERDPATPNRVVVAPSTTKLRTIKVGFPHKTYPFSELAPSPSFFFNALLDNRRYFLGITGGPRPGCVRSGPQPSAGSGYGSIDEEFLRDSNNVRGDTEQGNVPAGVIDCPGTYRLSISVVGNHSQPYPPFGSATFTVR